MVPADVASREAHVVNLTLMLRSARQSERQWLAERYLALRQREDALANRTLSLLVSLESALSVDQTSVPPVLDLDNNHEASLGQARAGGPLRARAGRRSAAGALLLPRAGNRSAGAAAAGMRTRRLPPAVRGADLVRAWHTAPPSCAASSPVPWLPLIDIAANVSTRVSTRLGARSSTTGKSLTLHGSAVSIPNLITNVSTAAAAPVVGVYALQLDANSPFCTQEPPVTSLAVATQQAAARVMVLVVHDPQAQDNTALPYVPQVDESSRSLTRSQGKSQGTAASFAAAAAAFWSRGRRASSVSPPPPQLASTTAVLLDVANSQSPRLMVHAGRLLLFSEVHVAVPGSAFMGAVVAQQLRQWSWPALQPLYGGRTISFRAAAHGFHSSSIPSLPMRGWVPLVVAPRHVLFSVALEPHTVVRCTLPSTSMPMQPSVRDASSVAGSGAMSNCTVRARTAAPLLWATAFTLRRKDRTDGERFAVGLDKAPPHAGPPCVRLRGMRVCLGHTDVLLPGTYKRTTYQYATPVIPHAAFQATYYSQAQPTMSRPPHGSLHFS